MHIGPIKTMLSAVAILLILVGIFNWVGVSTGNESAIEAVYAAVQFVGGWVIIGIAGVIETLEKIRATQGAFLGSVPTLTDDIEPKHETRVPITK